MERKRILNRIGVIFTACLLMLLASTHVLAATHNAASCSNADITTAISNASTGDIVVVPAGTCNWTGSIRIPDSKKITLQGAGYTSTTIATATGTSSYNISIGKSGSRITGFTISRINIYVNGVGFRIDHNYFYAPDPELVYIENDAQDGTPLYSIPTGLIDNNVFVNGRIVASAGAMMNHTDWTLPVDLGSGDNALYIEDNVFNRISPTSRTGNSVDGNYGGAYVFRYNTINGDYIEAHSVQAANRALKRWEVYGNQINRVDGVPFYYATRLRAGTGVYFFNSIVGNWTNRYIALDNVRSYDYREPFGRCDGTHTGVDGNEDATGYPCRDQIGRGYDTTLWTHSPAGAYAQPLVPAYFFANIGDSGLVTVSVINSSSDHIKANRDYYAQGASFDGTSGVGCGTLANRPATCTTGTAYWATNQSCSDVTEIVGAVDPGGNRTSTADKIEGTLYKCTSTNTWTAYYTPYTYPHPLSLSGGASNNGGGGETPVQPVQPVTPQYTLTVSSVHGTVGSVSAGINCSSAACVYSYNADTSFTLTAAAATGYTFAGWSVSDGSCTGTGTCAVTMNAAKTVTAQFAATTSSLSVEKTGTGTGIVTGGDGLINCGSTCSVNYEYGPSVTLTAAAYGGSTFAGWSGSGCTGTGTCIVTMTADRPVTATFTLIPPPSNYALTIVKNGTGNGSVSSNPGGIDCGATCSTSFTDGTSVQLTTTPVSGSTFAGWSGACTGTGTCIVSMTAARSVTATFTLIPPPSNYALTLVKDGTGNGTVSSNPIGIDCGATCSAEFVDGTSVQLTATPVSGSTFAGWSGACAGTGTSCVVAMTAARSVTARFTLIPPPSNYALTVLKDGSGSGTVVSTPTGVDCGATCSANFTGGTAVQLTATPITDHTFGGWSGDCTGTGICQVTMNATKSVRATFVKPNVIVLLIRKIGRGLGKIKSTNLYASVSPGVAATDIDCGDVCAREYDVETTVTLSAEPERGYSFAGWSGPCSGTGTCTVTVSELTTVTANFVANEADSGSPAPAVAGGGGGGGGGCFIATAAYGSYLDPHVMVLREFRDKVLLKNEYGRMFVAFYYKNSPAIADSISRIESLRLLTRLVLTPMVYAMAYPIVAAMILLAGLLLIEIAVRRKKQAKSIPLAASDSYFQRGPRGGFVRVR